MNLTKRQQNYYQLQKANTTNPINKSSGDDSLISCLELHHKLYTKEILQKFHCFRLFNVLNFLIISLPIKFIDFPLKNHPLIVSTYLLTWQKAEVYKMNRVKQYLKMYL